MGGSDPDNVTGEVLEALLDERFSHLVIQVVVGPSNSHLQSIDAQIEGRGNFRVLKDVQNMATLMADSDFAIGGGGTMLWERFFMELPSLVIPLAPNQRTGIEAVKGLKGVSQFLKSKRDGLLLGNYLAAALDRAQGQDETNDISEFDGVGEESLVVVDLLSGHFPRPFWSYRFVSSSDAELLWIWANDHEVRQNSISQASIPLEQHLTWFKSALSSEDVTIAVCEGKVGPIGCVRITEKAGQNEISYLTARQFRGLGWSVEMLRGGIDFWQKKSNPANDYKFVARVKSTNTSSQRVFTKLGFEIQSRESTRELLTFVSK
jgi:RimJ/RimL family protein N-acetyltransferase